MIKHLISLGDLAMYSFDDPAELGHHSTGISFFARELLAFPFRGGYDNSVMQVPHELHRVAKPALYDENVIMLRQSLEIPVP